MFKFKCFVSHSEFILQISLVASLSPTVAYFDFFLPNLPLSFIRNWWAVVVLFYLNSHVTFHLFHYFFSCPFLLSILRFSFVSFCFHVSLFLFYGNKLHFCFIFPFIKKKIVIFSIIFSFSLLLIFIIILIFHLFFFQFSSSCSCFFIILCLF